MYARGFIYISIVLKASLDDKERKQKKYGVLEKSCRIIKRGDRFCLLLPHPRHGPRTSPSSLSHVYDRGHWWREKCWAGAKVLTAICPISTHLLPAPRSVGKFHTSSLPPEPLSQASADPVRDSGADIAPGDQVPDSGGNARVVGASVHVPTVASGHDDDDDHHHHHHEKKSKTKIQN